MWPSWSHRLANLTKLTSINRKFKWMKSEEYYFEEIKRIVARNTLSTYPDFNKIFKIHNNASEFQLGLFITQKGKPIDLYSRNHTSSQQWCTVT